jgi:DNA replication ATP-dependent helicase Dna2
VEQRGWTYDLPKSAAENHIFGEVPISTYDRFTPSPNKSPSVKKTPRNPLSPIQERQSSSGLKKPAKKGLKILSGQKILGNKPVLQDVVNDLVG